MKNNKAFLFIVLVLLIGALSYWKIQKNKANDNDSTFKVGFIYLVQHPAIDAGIDGFKSEVSKIENETKYKFDITYANAFGEPKNINTIISDFNQSNYDIVVALTTPCAQIAKQKISDKPIVFVGVSDPIEAGLVKTLDNGENNMTGTSSIDPNYETLELAKKLFPKIKRIGILYSSSESNSISILKNVDKRIAEDQLGIEIIKRSITSTSEIFPVTKALLSEVDGIFLINDNTVISSVELLINETKKQNKLIFSSEVESVKKGALFTYGLNYKDEGTASANIVKEILVDNKKPSEIPIYLNKQYYLYVNKDLFKYSIDSTLIKDAKIVE